MPTWCCCKHQVETYLLDAKLAWCGVAWLLQDMNAMIDAAKYADLVLLMIDGGFGFEMETFEFLNICQVGLGEFL